MNLNEIPIDIESDDKVIIESDDESDFIEIEKDKQPHLVEHSSEVESRITPKKGMIFETLEESKVFYENYARHYGFGTKIKTTIKNEGIVRYKAFACSREGESKKIEHPFRTKHRAETRCHCPARMGVSLMKNTGKYEMSVFNSLHNHDVENMQTTHFFRAHRSIDKIQGRAIGMAESAGLDPTKIHKLMSLEATGSENLGFTKSNIGSYLRTKRIQDVSLRDLNVIQSYIIEESKRNPSFFHDHQVDSLGKLTNFLGADAKMIMDYEAFGDVLSFDTIFGTNKEMRSLAIFSGFNNHREIVTFGVALLYDETILSFGWVFQTFLQCHKEKLSYVLYTDQEKAMECAIV